MCFCYQAGADFLNQAQNTQHIRKHTVKLTTLNLKHLYEADTTKEGERQVTGWTRYVLST